MTSRRASSLLSWISITRYCRPNTVWSCFEKLTWPEIVGTLLELLHRAASAAPFVDRRPCLSAATIPSIAAAPVTKPPVSGLRPACASSVDGRVRVVTERRGVRDGVVVRHLRVLRSPVGAVAGPRVEDRRVVPERAEPRDERRQLAERTSRTTITSAFSPLRRRDRVADVVLERRVALLGRRSCRRAA